MFNIENVHYLLVSSTGKPYYIFYDSYKGLCFSTISSTAKWQSPISILNNAHRNFSCTFDDNGNAMTIVQDDEGNILLGTIADTFKFTPVLSSKKPVVYNKHLSIVNTDNTLNMFYVLKHNNQWLLSHQLFEDGKPSTPKAIDYIVNNIHPYSTVCDSNTNIYVFYELYDNDTSILGYKKYSSILKKWGEFVPICRVEEECRYPKAACDSSNIIHLCYQKKLSKQYQLIYQQKAFDKNIWSLEIPVYTSTIPFEQSSLIVSDKKIIIYWVRDENIFYCSSEDGGSTWNKPAKYIISNPRDVVCFRYCTDTKSNRHTLAASHIPGTPPPSLKFAFLDLAEIKNINSADPAKILNQRLDDIENKQKFLNDSILKLTKQLSELEKEVTKTTLRISMPDAQYVSSKFLASKLETLRNEIYRKIEELKNTANISNDCINPNEKE